jgi:Flp pilus assembly protein TadG
MLGRLSRNRSGAAAAEMALVAPVLLAVMFGAMELGYYFYSEHVMVKAVRDGARFASRAGFAKYDCSDETIDATTVANIQKITRTNQVASGGTSRLPNWTDDASVSVTMAGEDVGTYSSIYTGMACIPVVTVTADINYLPLFSILGFGTTNLHLRASSQAAVLGA